jgi:glycosyltransferase involved in cell wall biosynthesis
MRVEKQVLRRTHAKITILPIFIDRSRFAGLSHVPHPRFKKTILWIGRFESEKDPLYAIEALQRVRATGTDAGLVMLGSGSLENELREKAAREGLKEYVEFPGWQDLPAFLAQADVVLCTSRAESFGASIVEALLAGVPVVSEDVGVAFEAGAIIASRETLAEKTREVLETNTKGELKMPVLDQASWVESWKQSLQ